MLNHARSHNRATRTRVDNIKCERLIDDGVLWLLLKLGDTPHDAHRPEVYYQVLLPFLAGKPLQLAIAPTMTDEASEWTSPQRAGTCFYKCILATIRYYLRRHRLSQAQVKRVMCDLRREYLKEAHEQLSAITNADGEGMQQALRPADVPIIKLACKQTAHAAIKLHKKGMCNAQYVKETAQQVHDLLRLQEVCGSFPETGPERLDFKRLEPSNYARLGDLTSYITGMDTSGLRGSIIETMPQKRIDLLKLDMPSSTVDEVVELLAAHKVAAQELRSANSRSSTVMCYHMKALLRRLFCHKLPYDSSARLKQPRGGSLTKANQQKIVNDTWDLVKEYLAAWYNVPDHRDDTRCATRAMTVACAAAFVDTCLRATPSDGCGYLTRALTSEPSHLHFADDLNGPIEEALSDMAMPDCEMLDARARLLEYAAATRQVGTLIFNYVRHPARTWTTILFPDSPTLKFVQAVTEKWHLAADDTPDWQRLAKLFVASGGHMVANCPEFVVYRDLCFAMRYMLQWPAAAAESQHTRIWTPDDIKCAWSMTLVTRDEDKLQVTVTFMDAEGTHMRDPKKNCTHPAQYLKGLTTSATTLPTTEHDVAVAFLLESFGSTLKQEEAERLISFLTAPFLRIPLVVGYLTPAKVHVLFNAKLRTLLWEVLFQPLDFQPRAKLAGATITKVPTAARWKLATTHGALLHELQHAPGAVVGPLLQLFQHVVTMASVDDVGSPTCTVLCYTVRVTTAVHSALLHCLSMPSDHPCKPTTIPLDEIWELDEWLGELAQEQRRVLMRWAVQAEAEGNTTQAVRMHAHAALSASNVQHWTPADVATFVASTAYVQLWHSFSSTTRRADSELGFDASWLFDLIERHRGKLVQIMQEQAADYRTRAQVCQQVLRVATCNRQAQWAACAPGLDASACLGCYTQPGGDSELMVQLGQLTTREGPGPVPAPDYVATMPLFRSFVGSNMPLCVERECRAECTQLDVMGTKVQLTHWHAWRAAPLPVLAASWYWCCVFREFKEQFAKVEVRQKGARVGIFVTNDSDCAMRYTVRVESKTTGFTVSVRALLVNAGTRQLVATAPQLKYRDTYEVTRFSSKSLQEMPALPGWPMRLQASTGTRYRYLNRVYSRSISMNTLVRTDSAKAAGLPTAVLDVVRDVFRFEFVTQAMPVTGLKKVQCQCATVRISAPYMYTIAYTPTCLLCQLVTKDKADRITGHKKNLTQAVDSIELFVPDSTSPRTDDTMQQGVMKLLMQRESGCSAKPTFAEVRVNTRRNMLEIFTLVVSPACTASKFFK